jgi:hypothetical protein
MDWNTVAEKIIQDDQNKWDRKISAQKLRVSDAGALELAGANGNSGSFPLADLAVSQMCERLEIPARYFRRLPGEMQALVANYDLGRQNGKSFLLRGKGDWVRAFLSAEYVAYNNSEIAETVQGLLGNGALTMKSFVLEETHMFLKIISNEIWDVDSGLKAGIMIGNSEVGMGSVSVEPFVFRKPCTNDLIVSQEKSLRHAHIHLTAHELTRRMAEAVSEGFRVASSVLDAFLKTREVQVVDPLEVIRKIAEERKFSQKLTDEVVSSYLVEPEANRFGLINAFTNAAQKLGPLQRIEMERFAGTLLQTPLQ